MMWVCARQGYSLQEMKSNKMSSNNRYYLQTVAFCVAALLTGSCAAPLKPQPKEGAMTSLPLTYARNLRLNDHDDGWSEAEIINPWDTTHLLQRVALVPDSVAEVPSSVPEDAMVVRTPLRHSLITTSMHLNLLSELGVNEAVAGVTDAAYIRVKYVNDGLADGSIMDCGATASPTIERVISLCADGILVSPYETGGDYGKLEKLGVPVIYTADYAEAEPLGRAEWMKYYGMLFGREAEADSLFEAVAEDYNRQCARIDRIIAGDSRRPSVVLDQPYQGTWWVNGEGAVTDVFIRKAGGSNPFSTKEKGNTVAYAPERVLIEAGNADVWLIRYYAEKEMTLKDLERNTPMASRFAAFASGNVYGVNTAREMYFDEVPFHPEYLLGDLCEILHPTSENPKLRYFKKLE